MIWNTLRPRRNILKQISLKCVPKCPVNNKPALVQIIRCQKVMINFSPAGEFYPCSTLSIQPL